MYRITIKGEAKTNYDYLPALDGIDCQEEFTQYFGKEQEILEDKNVREGFAEFRYEDGKLYVVTSYTSDEALTKEEMDILREYTEGQWSDGIGENFEQEACAFLDDEEVYISMWNSDTYEIDVEQEEV